MPALLAPVASLAYNGPVDDQVATLTEAREAPESRERFPRLCVYTSLLGGYEVLNEQPVAGESEIPFICFTDDPEQRSETWQLRVVSPLFALDAARSQRDFKLRPHVHLPEYDLSLYIDNAVILTKPPEQVFDRYHPKTGFALAKHSFRESVLAEFMEVIRRGYDDPNRVFEQLNHYTLSCPEVLEERPYWGGIELRDHRDPSVRAMLNIWYANVLRYSRRDQLSLNAAFLQSGLVPDLMDIENYNSWFHTWPHAAGRDREKGTLTPSVSFSPPVALVHQLQQQVTDVQKQREDILASESWQVGKWLTDSAKRHPLVMGPILRTFKRLSQSRRQS